MIYFDIYFEKSCQALGNGMTTVSGLYKCLVLSHFSAINRGFEIHYQSWSQGIFASCIPGVKEYQIKKVSKLDKCNYEYTRFNQGWRFWRSPPYVKLCIPNSYRPKFEVPRGAIAIHAREAGTYDSGWGADHQPERFVNVETFHKIALEYANKGHMVIQIGTKEMTRFPDHENIFCLSHLPGKTLMDDLYAMDNCDVMLGTESGMEVCAASFSTPTILSNSCHPVERWWPKVEVGHFVLNKKLVENSSGKVLSNQEIVDKWGPKRYFARPGYTLLDNTYEELKGAIDIYL